LQYRIAFKILLFTYLIARSNGLDAQDLDNINKQKPFEIHGTAAGSVGYYDASSVFNSTRKPYSYSIMLAPVIAIYGIQIPFTFTFTEGSKILTNPFAQFGITPHWKWIKLYAGWTNMTWSPTTLNGKTFLGVGIELNPKLFRFGAMYGRFNPAIKQDTLNTSITPQYKRTGYAFKLGVGNEKNFVDIIFLKAKDIQNSIPTPSDTQGNAAQENAVFGINSHQSFLGQKLIWNLDGAVSAYTRELNSQLLNIGDGMGPELLKSVILPRLSTSYAWTAHTNLAYKTPKFSLGFDYSRIQPEYASMGLDYLVNDMQKFFFNQGFNTSKNKLIISLSEFFQNDDLNNRKLVKTDRTGLNGSVAWTPSQKFGVTFVYNNFLMFQQKGLVAVNDTTMIFQVQQGITVSPHYTIMSTKKVQNIYMVISYQRLDDLNQFTSKFSDNSTLNGNISYLISVTKVAFSFAPSVNVLYSKTPNFNVLSTGPTFVFTKGFLKGKINASVSIGYTAGQQNSSWNSQTINNVASISYRVTKHHSLRLSNNVKLTYISTDGTHEFKGDVTYTYTF
jgi:hypothetical protein